MSLRPFATLDDDYYTGGAWKDDSDEEEMRLVCRQLCSFKVFEFL